jgi:SAM-dependent methyltransferase
MAEREADHWWYRSTRALLADVLGPVATPGALVLDAGAGTGATAAWLAEHSHLVAADVEPLALSLLRERHPGADPVAADVTRLPFADGAFDAVVCVTVLYHAAVASPLAAVGELARVCRPGGLVCLLEPGVRRLRRPHDRMTHTARRFSVGDVRRLLAGNGLTVERATGAYAFLVPAAAAKAALERGRTASDLDASPGGLGDVLTRLATAERAVLRRRSLPFGLSILAVGRKP